MRNILLSYNIARKLNSSVKAKQVSVSVKIASISIAVSLIVMLISSAVVVGFRSDISNRLFDFTADFQIVESSSYALGDDKSLSVKNYFTQSVSSLDFVEGISKYIFKTALLKTDASMKGVALKGVGDDFDWNRILPYIVAGEVINTSDSVRHKQIVISQRLANQLELKLGDRVEVAYFTKPMRRDLLTISGIFSCNLPDIDDNFVYCDIRDLQRINQWDKTMVTGYDVFLNDDSRYEETRNKITKLLYSSNEIGSHPKRLLDTRSEYDYIFGWFDMQKTNELVIIIIMIIVSVFNVISMTLIILLQKTSMIGVLKSLGMKDYVIQFIFVIRGMKELLLGVFAGNVLGIVLCWVQLKYKIIKLDSSSYMVSSVPIELDIDRILVINGILLLMLLVSQLLVTHIVTKIQPYKAIKYEKR